MKRKERVFYVPVKYTMEGIIEVVANTIEDAEKIALEDEDIPDNADYADGSININYKSKDYGYFEDNYYNELDRRYENSQF